MRHTYTDMIRPDCRAAEKRGFTIANPKDEKWLGYRLSSYHPGGAQAAFFDGHVRLLPQTIDEETLERLMLPDDGEPVGDF
jgi:prepilin-type processing-associated H-X9-DG protein